MNGTLELVLVSASPIFSRGMKLWLESGPERLECRTLQDEYLRSPQRVSASAVLLIAPQHWREMAHWLPCLQTHVPHQAWLILADLRIAGMFWSLLEARLCTLLAPGAAPEELRLSIQMLARGSADYPPAALLRRFAEQAPALPDGGKVILTPKELQCGCAVSLGLSNPQIAEVLHLAEGTVKSHVHHLMRKLEFTAREELAAYFERVFAPLSLPFG